MPEGSQLSRLWRRRPWRCLGAESNQSVVVIPSWGVICFVPVSSPQCQHPKGQEPSTSTARHRRTWGNGCHG